MAEGCTQTRWQSLAWRPVLPTPLSAAKTQWARGHWALGSQCLWAPTPSLSLLPLSSSALRRPHISKPLRVKVPSATPPHRSGFLPTPLEGHSLVPRFSARREPPSVPPTLFREPRIAGRGGKEGGQPGRLGTKVCLRTGPHNSSACGHSLWAQALPGSLGVLDPGSAWTLSLSATASRVKARPPSPSTQLLPAEQVTTPQSQTTTVPTAGCFSFLRLSPSENLSLTTQHRGAPRPSIIAPFNLHAVDAHPFLLSS